MQNLESWQARDVLAVFERMNARPGFRLSVQALWHSGRGQVVKAGLDWLVSADYVEISADKTSIILKEAGYNIISGRDPGPIPVPSVTARPARRAIILTALDVETSAVLRRIANREEVVVRGTVFYSGNFEDWDLAVAEVGSGNSPAAVIAERAIQHFDPQVALFVGVPGRIKDVEIGDVVVATKVYGYERGKDDEGGFKPRPDVQVSAHGLEQRGRAIRQKSSWKSRLDPGLASSAARIYVGPMAAGEKVVASTRAPIAQFLREYYSDALAVEMEGRGFLEGVHLNAPVQGCVIRGISDLLSGKTAADTQGSQQHAADAASAVAFEILATLHGAM